MFSRNTQGFTLLEILLCVAIFGLLISTGLGFSLSLYNSYIWGEKRQTLITDLYAGRGAAIHHNILNSWAVGSIQFRSDGTLAFDNVRVLSDGTHFATITVNHEEAISW